MVRITKLVVVVVLVLASLATIATPAMARRPCSRRTRLVPVVPLPDGVVGEPYHNGRIRPKCFPTATTWDIWEGSPPPPDWSLALYERGIHEYHRGEGTFFTPPWDLETIEASWYGTLPPGLYLDQFGGLIFGTPTQRGRFTIYASAFAPDGTQMRVPYHSITIRERLATPAIYLRAVRDALLTWEGIPYASGYRLYVNGVFARQVGAVTTFDLDSLDLVESETGHYITIVAVSTDDLFIASRGSNSVRYSPSAAGSVAVGDPEAPLLLLSYGITYSFGMVPQTSVPDITGLFVAMCISILATVSLLIFGYFHFTGTRRRNEWNI